MKIEHQAVAGSLESSDVLITITPADKGLSVNVESVVMQQWGAHIKKTVEEAMKNAGVTDAVVDVKDRGALECTLQARIEAVLARAAK